MIARIWLAAVACLLLAAGSAAGAELRPFKDRLFAYPAILDSADGGAYRVVDYREMRDINGRDAVPERRAKARYVSTGVRRVQADLVARTAAGNVPHFAVGTAVGARMITIYLHGRGGNRHQGVDDHSFGGNFNRIKNLMAVNGGLYLSPDFTDFGAAGEAEIAGLIELYGSHSPGAKVFVACGSMGGNLCWRLAANPEIADRLGGLILLGSYWNDDFTASAAYKRRVPVFIGHGSNDSVFPVERMERFYRAIRDRGYPIRFVRFETGSHGTPIRMTDWRETINWMLSAGG